MVQLTFGGVPTTPATLTTGTGLSFPTSPNGGTVPQSGPGGISGFLSSVFSMGTTVGASHPGTSYPSLGASAPTPQPVAQGNTPQLTGIGADMRTILDAWGLGQNAAAGGNPTATPASFMTGPAQAPAQGHSMLLIGAVMIGGFLLLRRH